MSAECSVDGCTRERKVRVWCTMHYNRWYLTGDTRGAEREWGDKHHNWSDSAITYRGMHDRIRTQKGSASNQACLHCGKEAEHWAYDHSDESELHENGSPYSLDVDHYFPLCAACHKRFDAKPLPTHCKRGHEYPPETASIASNGSRVCRICRRERRPSRSRPPRTECIHGHPYDDETTGMTAAGRRYCKTCSRERARAQRVEQRERNRKKREEAEAA